MIKSIGIGVAVVLVALMHHSAAADGKDDLTAAFKAYAAFEPNPANYVTLFDLTYPREYYPCRNLVERAGNELKPDDELASASFLGHPKARADGDKWAVKVSDLSWFCSRVSDRIGAWQLVALIALSKQWEGYIARGFTDDDRTTMTADLARTMESAPLHCQILITEIELDAALADLGTRDDKAKNENVVPPGAAAACETMAKWNVIYQAEWKTKFAELAKPFEAAGITGDRLEQLMYHAPNTKSWLVKGCKAAKNIKQFKQAKALFQRFTMSDNKVMIRRYEFNGDKLVNSRDTEFPTKKAADKKGCK